jgi:hypothetical protein
MRRFRPDERFTIQGVDLRVFRGEKPGDDLVLKAYINGRWLPLSMDWLFLMADFLAENENYIGEFRPHWRLNGSAYLTEHVALAVKKGWRVASDKLARERRRAS